MPLCQLFQGRIVDKPEARLPATELTSGGEIEHELFALDPGVILLVYELTFAFSAGAGRVEAAQVFLEMQGECNSTARSLVLLTDLCSGMVLQLRQRPLPAATRVCSPNRFEGLHAIQVRWNCVHDPRANLGC